MSRRRYLVAYDISDPRRLRAVHSAMKGFGYPMQYSVFICDLDRQEKVDLRQAIGDLMDHREDRVVVVDLGDLDVDPERMFEFMGRPSPLPRRGPTVI